MHLFERGFITAIAVSVAWFFALTLFRLTLLQRWTVPPHYRWLREVTRDLALVLGPLAMTILIWEYWLRVPRLEETKTVLVHAIEEQNADITSLRRNGIISIWTESNQTHVRAFMKTARRRMVFLAPWFLDPTTVEPVFKELCSTTQLDMTVLLVSPTSSFARIRGTMLTGNGDYGPSESRRSLDAMRRVYRTLKGKHKRGTSRAARRFKVMLFDTMPAVYIVIADDRALIGFFSHVGTALDTPIIQCRMTDENGKPTPFGAFAEAEIVKVLSVSGAADLDDESTTQPVGRVQPDGPIP